MHRFYSLALPVLVASTSGAIPTIPTVPPPGPPTSGIVALDDGTVFFVDSFHRTVWRVQPGRGMSAFVTGLNGRSLQLDERGNIYGTHQEAPGRLVTWRADPAGTVTLLNRTAVPEQHGHAFVLDDGGEVIGWTGTGKRTGVRLWRAHEHQRQLIAGGDWGFRDGAGSDARFFPIGAMTRTQDGEILLTSGATIRRIRQNGSVSTVTASEKLLRPRNSLLARLLGDVQGHLTGIAVDCDGNIYVANSARGAVVRINADGHAEDVAVSDAGWTPTGVAAANGSLYVLEYGAGVRVRRIDPDGTTWLVASVRPDLRRDEGMKARREETTSLGWRPRPLSG